MNSSETTRTETTPILLVTLFDISRSADRDHYMTDFKSLTKNINYEDGASVVADVIGPNSETSPNRVTVEIEPCSSDNPLTCQKDLDEQKQNLMEQVDRLLSADQELGTDIFGALRLSSKSLHPQEQSGQPVLVLFSDMINSSPKLRFGEIDWSQSAIQRIANHENSSRPVPDLQGVEICVAGAGVTEHPKVSSEDLAWIQEFWTQYFKAAGTTLSNDRYAPRLTNCT